MAEGLRRNLKLGADPIEFELVYWADLVYPAPLDPDPAPYTPAEGAGELPRHEDSFLGRVKHLAKEAVGGLLDKGTALPGVDEAAEEVIARKATDLQRYYEDPAKRRAIRQRLGEVLRAAHKSGRRIMLIAHSMGSIVAFDVLSAVESEITGLSIQHFVTVGSPLGLHEVKERIRKEGLPLQVSDAVVRWTNFANRKDKVALESRLHADFRANSRGVGVVDQVVINGYVSPSGKPSHHKIYGYLRTPEVSLAIHELMGT